MTDETRAELRRGIEAVVRAGGTDDPELRVDIRNRGHSASAQVYSNVPYIFDLPPLTTAQQLALSVLLGDESVLPQALADYLLDQGHEYATAIMRQSTDEGVKAGIETEKARCLHLCGLARSYFARGGAVSNMAANELRLAIEGNLKPTPKAFFRSSLLR